MKLALQTDDNTEVHSSEPKWHTYADDGNGAVEFLLRPWTRSTETDVNKRADKKIALLSMSEEERARLPKGTGNRKLETRAIELADYLIADWRGVVGPDSVTPVPCSTFNKTWAFESGDVAMWCIEKAKQGGARLVEDEAGN